MRDSLRDLRKTIIPNGHFPNNWVKQYKTVQPFPEVLYRLDFTQWRKLFLPLVFFNQSMARYRESEINNKKHET